MTDRFVLRCRAAKEACRRFASQHGWAIDDLHERQIDTRHTTLFVYTAPDGREFGCGAEKMPRIDEALAS